MSKHNILYHRPKSLKNFPFEFDATKEIVFYPKNFLEHPIPILEIGPGTGSTLFYLSKKFKDQNILGIELSKGRFDSISGKIKREQNKNVGIIRGDARIVIPQHFKENTFERVYVLFPDPWPKSRHMFRRLLQIEMLWLIAFVLKPGGKFIFGTDVKDYATWVYKNIQQVRWLKNIYAPAHWKPELADHPNTSFEKKWKKLGREVFFMEYIKNDT